MLTKNFLQLQTEVQCHVEADRVAQSSYRTCITSCLAGGENSPKFIEREYGIPLAVSHIAEIIFKGLPSDEATSFFAALPDAIESDGKNLSLIVWQFLAAELRSLPPVTPEVQAVIDPVIDGMDLLVQGKEWSKKDAEAADSAARAAADAAGSAAADAAANAASSAARAAKDAAKVARAVCSAVFSADWAVSAAASAAARAAADAAGWATDEAASAAASAAGWGTGAHWALRVATRRRQRDLLLKLIKEAPVTTTTGGQLMLINGELLEAIGLEIKPGANPILIDALAAIIRKVDCNNSLGAAALAEAIINEAVQ
jgi:hypothetical protein